MLAFYFDVATYGDTECGGLN